MAGGRLPSDVVRERREAVKTLWLKGFSSREIAEALLEWKIVNPTTGEKYAHTTIANDIQVFEKEYQEHRASEVSAARAKSMDKLVMLEQAAWAEYERQKGGKQGPAALAIVKQIIADQRKIYGVDAPTKQQILGKDEGPVEVVITFTEEAAKL